MVLVYREYKPTCIERNYGQLVPKHLKARCFIPYNVPNEDANNIFIPAPNVMMNMALSKNTVCKPCNPITEEKPIGIRCCFPKEPCSPSPCCSPKPCCSPSPCCSPKPCCSPSPCFSPMPCYSPCRPNPCCNPCRPAPCCCKKKGKKGQKNNSSSSSCSDSSDRKGKSNVSIPGIKLSKRLYDSKFGQDDFIQRKSLAKEVSSGPPSISYHCYPSQVQPETTPLQPQCFCPPLGQASPPARSPLKSKVLGLLHYDVDHPDCGPYITLPTGEKIFSQRRVNARGTSYVWDPVAIKNFIYRPSKNCVTIPCYTSIVEYDNPPITSNSPTSNISVDNHRRRRTDSSAELGHFGTKKKMNAGVQNYSQSSYRCYSHETEPSVEWLDIEVPNNPVLNSIGIQWSGIEQADAETQITLPKTDQQISTTELQRPQDSIVKSNSLSEKWINDFDTQKHKMLKTQRQVNKVVNFMHSSLHYLEEQQKSHSQIPGSKILGNSDSRTFFFNSEDQLEMLRHNRHRRNRIPEPQHDKRENMNYQNASKSNEKPQRKRKLKKLKKHKKPINNKYDSNSSKSTLPSENKDLKFSHKLSFDNFEDTFPKHAQLSKRTSESMSRLLNPTGSQCDDYNYCFDDCCNFPDPTSFNSMDVMLPTNNDLTANYECDGYNSQTDVRENFPHFASSQLSFPKKPRKRSKQLSHRKKSYKIKEHFKYPKTDLGLEKSKQSNYSQDPTTINYVLISDSFLESAIQCSDDLPQGSNPFHHEHRPVSWRRSNWSQSSKLTPSIETPYSVILCPQCDYYDQPYGSDIYPTRRRHRKKRRWYFEGTRYAAKKRD